MTRLTVVLVSYQTRSLLLELIEHLQASPQIDLIVVDNASKDGSADAVHERFPAIDLIRNPANVGFATAANQGINRAKTEFVALINPDTDATPGLLLDLVAYLEQDPRVWAVAPRLIGRDGSPQTLAAGFAPTPLRAFSYFLGLSYVLPWPSAGFSVSPRVTRPIEVDWLSGACLVFRRELVASSVGLLDETFFLYGEDMDWCRRMRRAGGRLVFMGDHDLAHARAASSGHEVVSTDWLIGLVRYVRPQASRTATRLFFLAAASGFWLRGLRFVGKRLRLRRSTLWRYAGAALQIAMVPERAAPSTIGLGKSSTG